MRIGVDVGGTTVKIGVADNYKIIDKFVVKTKKESLFQDVLEGIKEHLGADINKVEFIGFGLPGHAEDGFVYKLTNVEGVENVDLRALCNSYFPGIPMGTTNDANAAALGEALNDPNNPESSYLLTLGTGVGGGYVYNHKVIDGKHNSCGEIGHMFIDYKHNYKCNCGLTGCLETVASATGIVRLAKEYYSDYKTTLNKDTMSAKDVFDAAKQGDELGLYVLDLVGMYLGRGLAAIGCTTDPEVFYIGGGVSAAGQILIDKITEYYKKYAFYSMKDTRITLARMGNDAGMLGAAYIK